MEKWKIFVVPHTHWDKEWYFTKQDSDILLLQNFNNAIEILTKNKNYKTFTYDGQYSTIEDYLNYFPDKKGQLIDLVKKNKITSGPWYTQPDFFNVTSESIVRNLLYGIKLSNQNFGKHLNVAYVPDSFGHVEQMPQIYNQFNLKNFIYWRGARKRDIDQTGVYHFWKGIDGSKVNAYNFYLGYWSIGTFFPYTTLKLENLKQQAQKFLIDSQDVLNKLKQKCINTSKILLIPLGGDQAPIVNLLPEFIQQVNLQSDDEWILSNYEEYFKQVDQTKNEAEIKTISGELKSPNLSRIHKTIGSQRYDIKKTLKETESLLFNNLEPLASYWMQYGGDYPSQVIDQVMKWLMTSQAHDSAGGCNSDRTNEDVLNRIKQAQDLILSEITKIIKQISINNNLSFNDLLIFNPKSYNLKITKPYVIFTDFQNFEILNNKQKLDYVILEQQYNRQGMKVSADPSGEKSENLTGFYETKIVFSNLVLNSLSFECLKITQSDNLLKLPTILKDEKNIIENNSYKISINNNGTVDILDKKNQTSLKNQFQIYANVDGGDSYDFSPINEQNNIVNKLVEQKTKVVQLSNNAYKIEILELHQIPYSLNYQKLISQPIKKELYIIDGKINLKISLDNLAKNIRWRIISSVNEKNDYSYANQAFATIKRPVELTQDLKEWEEKKWVEKPVAIETNESFVYLKNNETITGFLTKGNNEYEIINQNEIHLTLFRSVDLLGRNDLLWRPGRASGTSEFLIQTDQATLLNKTLEFDLEFFNLPNDSNIWKVAEEFNTQNIYYQNQNLNNLYKKFDRFLLPKTNVLVPINEILFKITNDNFVVKTIKKSWDGNKIVIRGFNQSDQKIDIAIFSDNKPIVFTKTNLLEQKINEDKYDCLRPYEIATYIIELEK